MTSDGSGKRPSDPDGQGDDRNDESDASGRRGARPRGDRSSSRGGRRRRRVRPVPPDIVESDELEDGHDRVIDPREAGAAIYPDHGLGAELIDPDAAKVLSRLHRHGFQAYLVGGCVRDLLLGFKPKDFDIATSATPRQIKKLFRNSRIIGRRFRLVHIHFGDHVLEVSTFRSDIVRADGDDLLIRRDNVFGRADQDARRRDFTCNALFFDVERSEVIDFVGGIPDLRRRRIEVIGDPVTRLREDPVRMLRAVKFAGRLGFELAEDLLEGIRIVREDLKKSAAPRLHEEVLRLLNNRGGAYSAFRLLQKTKLLEVLLPEIAPVATDEEPPAEEGELSVGQKFWNSLRALDRLLAEERPVSNAVLLGTMFVHLFDEVLSHNGPLPEGSHPAQYDISLIAEDVLGSLGGRLQMPRRDLYRMKQIIIALRRFMASKQSRKRPSPSQLIRKDYFLDALTLFEIYSTAIGRHQGEVIRWQRRFEETQGR